MTGILILLVIVSLGIAGGLHMSALADIEPMIPMQFKPPYLDRAPMEPFVWSGFSSRKARRKYVASLSFGSLSSALIAVVEISEGPRWAVFVFGTFAVYAATYACVKLWKHRELF